MARVLILGALLLFASLGGIVQWAPGWLNPGPLLEGHRKLDGNCFACHTPFSGPIDEKCIACHPVEKIGAGNPKKTAFHQQLSEQECIACHTDHQGRKAGAATRAFSHALLKEEAGRCQDCHRPAKDRLHEKLTGNCDQCHGTKAWKPAAFDHTGVKDCLGCHQGPRDRMHAKLTGNCDQCHGTQAWKPATLDHDRLFRFDRDHPEDCAACHPKGDYKSYTCYGCHEHSAGKVRREHLEEGIGVFDNCVACHRSGDEDEAERIWKRLRRQGEGAAFLGTAYQRRDGEGRRHHDDDDDDDDD